MAFLHRCTVHYCEWTVLMEEAIPVSHALLYMSPLAKPVQAVCFSFLKQHRLV